MDAEEDTYPETPALDAWHEANPQMPTDRAQIRVWYPREAPYAILQTHSRGYRGPDYLPDGPVHVDLKMAGGYSIGGSLDEIEAYIKACAEALRCARWSAEQLLAEAENDGGE